MTERSTDSKFEIKFQLYKLHCDKLLKLWGDDLQVTPV